MTPERKREPRHAEMMRAGLKKKRDRERRIDMKRLAENVRILKEANKAKAKGKK